MDNKLGYDKPVPVVIDVEAREKPSGVHESIHNLGAATGRAIKANYQQGSWVVKLLWWVMLVGLVVAVIKGQMHP